MPHEHGVEVNWICGLGDEGRGHGYSNFSGSERMSISSAYSRRSRMRRCLALPSHGTSVSYRCNGLTAGKRLRHRKGVTLIELMVTLVLLSVVALITSLLVSTNTHAIETLQLHAATLNKEASSMTYLRELFEHTVDFSDDTALGPRFDGNLQSSTFRTWCRTSDGYRRICDAFVAIEDSASVSRVHVQAGDADFHVSMRGTVRLQFLDGHASPSRWITTWERSAVLPSAVGLVGPRDTIAYVVGR